MLERRSEKNGFLLVEALFAFAIVAMMSALVYLTISQVSHTTKVVLERRSALLLARSVLDAASVESRANPISRTGRDGNLAWSVAVEGYRSDEVEMVPLRKVSVTITDLSGQNRLAHLSTLVAGQ